MSLRCVLLASVLVGLTFYGGATARPAAKGPWKAVLPEAEFAKLVTAEGKVVQESLAKMSDEKDAAVKKKLESKAKVAAVMAAGYAQSAMLGNAAKAGQLAGLRDHALQVAKAITDGKFDDAKKLAADISPTAKGVAGAKTEPADLHKHFDLTELMTQFKPERSGVGRELEGHIKAIVNKRGTAPMPAKMLNDGAASAWQTAVIAQFTEVMGPDADMGAKKKADWVKWSQEMGELAVDAAKLAGGAKPDATAVKAAFKKLDDNCAKCHAVFRD